MSRLLQVWGVLCLVLVLGAFATSEGEPVCRGPLITSVDDSLPPQCDGPAAGLLVALPAIAGIGLLLAFATIAVGSAIQRAVVRRR